MAQMKFNPVSELQDLTTIVSQLEAAQSVNRETRQRAMVWAKMADQVDAAITATEGPYAELTSQLDKDSLNAASVALRAVGTLLSPTAELTWTKDQLDEKTLGVQFFHARGAYEGDDVALAESTLRKLEALTSKKGGSTGQRAPRTESAPIEGRPATVRVEDVNGNKISEQAGNKDNSVSNLAAAIRRYVEKGSNQALTDEQNAAVRECVRLAVEEGQSPVAVGDFARVVIV